MLAPGRPGEPGRDWPWDRRDQAARWLLWAGAALAVLAGAAAAVSYAAQYRLVLAVKDVSWAALLEAGIPDTAALVFACLGIALALDGRRAFRARALNLAAVGTSVVMNVLAAGPGWRDLAVWVLPPAAYALASDSLIVVVRQHALARAGRPDGIGERTPVQALGWVALWLLRLAVAPPSTLRGLRRWLVTEVPSAPPYMVIEASAGETAPEPDRQPPDLGRSRPARCLQPRPALSALPGQARPPPRAGTKQARLISEAAAQRDLTQIPLAEVAALATSLAGQADLHPGTARRVLLAHVRQLQAQAGEGQR